MEYIVYNMDEFFRHTNEKVFHNFDEAIDDVIKRKNKRRLNLQIKEVKSRSYMRIPLNINGKYDEMNKELFIHSVIYYVKRECEEFSGLGEIIKNLRNELGDKYGKI